MKTKKFILGIFIFLIGIEVVLHASDINPIWYIFPGYLTWLNEHIHLPHTPGMGLLWIVSCIVVGSLIANFGLKIMEKVSKKA